MLHKDNPLLIKLDYRSKYLRKLVIQMVDAGRRGHIGSALSVVEILRVLYDDVLLYKAKNPRWEKRDRFILSKGHGCLAIYAILADKKYFPLSHLSKFCHDDALLGGHPDHHIPGVEISTGSLGHGFPIAVGMALNAKKSNLKHRVFVLMGDGETDEGSVWEGALVAGKYKLNNLTVIIDYNKLQSYGFTKDIQDLEPIVQKWRSFGFATAEVNGHNIIQLRKVFSQLPINPEKPNLIICHTVKGKGIKQAENNPSWHHLRGLTDEKISEIYKELKEY
jgi:transketolase